MRDQLLEALDEASIVSIDREAFEEHLELGRIFAVDRGLFAMALVSDGIRRNGWSILRVEDVTGVELPHEHAEFVEAALRLRGELTEAPPPLDLESWATALRSLLPAAEVITIHTEERTPGLCTIGHVQSLGDASLRLVEIDPDADWADEETEVALDDITRIDFGGDYEAALLLVGGACPWPRLRAVE